MKCERLLIIMHSNNTIYGAGKSLLNWVNEADISFDLIYPKTFFLEKGGDRIKKEMKGLENIYCEWLPFSRCYLGKNGVSIKGFYYQIINNIMYFINRKRVDNIIKKYDKIYLNSLVLWPLIRKDNVFYIHIREIFDGSSYLYKKIRNKLSNVNGKIYIDYTTFQKLEKIEGKKIILNNPFDMRKVKTIDFQETLNKLGIQENKKVFCIIGMIYETKGVKFIIESFLEAQIDAYLLIVGKVKGTYARECMKISQKNCKVIFLGEIEEIEEIYAITDFVIRGEPCFCIGRTVYEGLYSGCAVIVPGKNEDLQYCEDVGELQDNIHFYNPRNKQDLIRVLTSVDGVIRGKREFRSNVENYTRKIKEFMELNCEKEV